MCLCCNCSVSLCKAFFPLPINTCTGSYTYYLLAHHYFYYSGLQTQMWCVCSYDTNTQVTSFTEWHFVGKFVHTTCRVGHVDDNAEDDRCFLMRSEMRRFSLTCEERCYMSLYPLLACLLKKHNENVMRNKYFSCSLYCAVLQ